MKKLITLLMIASAMLPSMAGDIIVKPVFANASANETNWGGTIDNMKENPNYKMTLVPGTTNLYTCTIHLNKYYKTNKWKSGYGNTYQPNEGWRNEHSFSCVDTDDFGSITAQLSATDLGSAVSKNQTFTIYDENGEDVTFYALVNSAGKVHSYCDKMNETMLNGPSFGGKPDQDLKVTTYFTKGQVYKIKIVGNSNYYWQNDVVSSTDYYIGVGLAKVTLDLRTFKFTIESGLLDYPLTVTAAGASTLMLPYEATIPEGVKAYTLTHNEGDDTAIATELTGIIPAKTPVLINAAAGTYHFKGTQTIDDKNNTTVVGALCGTRIATNVPVGSYVLQDHDGEVGFYLVETANSVLLSGNHAYFTPAVATQAAKINIVYPQTTGITAVKNTLNENDAIYNLAGQRVGKDYRGIVIRNGKKYINR